MSKSAKRKHQLKTDAQQIDTAIVKYYEVGREKPDQQALRV